MMKCQDYIFRLTSGQLDEAGWLLRLQATQHRWACGNCRAFTKNDQRMDRILKTYAEHLVEPQAPDGPSGS